MKYLSYEVGSEQLAPVKAKVEALVNFPPPATKKALRRFLGVTGFYRRFIPRFSEIAAPLTNLLRGSKKGSISLLWT